MPCFLYLVCICQDAVGHQHLWVCQFLEVLRGAHGPSQGSNQLADSLLLLLCCGITEDIDSTKNLSCHSLPFYILVPEQRTFIPLRAVPNGDVVLEDSTRCGKLLEAKRQSQACIVLSDLLKSSL